ncbi:MAG TPA: ectonucleotide pyrophosphatase/phosphodiesterase [archaeon]|nr:ectonucleotide pyrophosphatase/phosphodiesterase [archaeon]
MRRWITFIAVWAALAPSLLHSGQSARAQSAPAKPIEHVIIISVDGLKPQSYTEPDTHGLKVPTLREIVSHGAWSSGAMPVMPSVTYPSHTSMVTGVHPGLHGIFTNTAWDPLEKNYAGYRWYEEDIRVPTLWQVARQRGLRTALVHWPVTVGAQSDFIVPEYWRASIPEDLKLLRALSTPGVFGEVTKEFPEISTEIQPPLQADAVWADIACYALETLRPHLLLLHIDMVDHWQHEKGPFSAEGNAAIEDSDAQIARVIAAAKKAGLWDTTVLVIVSDHGFVPISQALRPGVLLRDRGLVTLDAQNHPLSWKASVLTNAGSAYIYVKDAADDATRRTLLEIFQPLAGAEGSGIRRLAAHPEIVAMGGDADAFLALEAADGTSFIPGYAGDLKGPSKIAGTHGYFPDRPEMRASLLVYGPAIGAGRIDNARLIDVGPTVASWLGFDLPKAEGVPLTIPAPAPAAEK